MPQNAYSYRFCVTKVSGYILFGYFLILFHVLIEIYLLVPFPPSVREGFSDYTRTSLRWGPVTSAMTSASTARCARDELEHKEPSCIAESGTGETGKR